MKQFLKYIYIVALVAFIVLGIWLCSRTFLFFGFWSGAVGFIVFFAAYLFSGWALVKAFKYGANY